MWPGPKPKLVFFRPTRTDLPRFIVQHLDDHVRCLAQYFDVEVVTKNADYDQVCDRIQPDIALFESGIYVRSDRRIRNTHTHPEVMKLGLLDADAYCVTRSVFLSDMDEWGVGDFVSHSIAMPSHMPEIGDSLFVWPNFADSATFHSYPGAKSETILLSGSRASNYPWRVAVDRVLSERFPVRAMKHEGWFDRAAAADMPVGEEYAVRLSRALIVPTCGTIAHELVRKHIEIPAAGSLLVTERTPAVESAGFVDGVNCLFADEHDVADRVADALADRERLAEMTVAGQRLAHEHHDIDNRDQVRQWFELTRTSKARGLGERVVQPHPFASLELAGRAPSRSAIDVGGRDRELIELGTQSLERADVAAAEASFAAALDFHFMPEAAIGSARVHLAAGRPDEALRVISFTIEQSLTIHRASVPDPVEWSMLVRALLCGGRISEARRRARRYSALRHPELDRVRRFLGIVIQSDVATRSSVHAVADVPDEEWLRGLQRDLAACASATSSAPLPAQYRPGTVRRAALAAQRRVRRALSLRGRP